MGRVVRSTVTQQVERPITPPIELLQKRHLASGGALSFLVSQRRKD
jgi:hypothetical protein